MHRKKIRSSIFFRPRTLPRMRDVPRPSSEPREPDLPARPGTYIGARYLKTANRKQASSSTASQALRALEVVAESSEPVSMACVAERLGGRTDYRLPHAGHAGRGRLRLSRRYLEALYPQLQGRVAQQKPAGGKRDFEANTGIAEERVSAPPN